MKIYTLTKILKNSPYPRILFLKVKKKIKNL